MRRRNADLDELVSGAMRVGLSALVVAMALLAGPGIARAQGDIELQWTAPPACPGSEGVRHEVERAMSQVASPRPLHASVVIDRSAGGWHADVDVQGGTYHRSFDAPSCDELASAVGLVLSLVVSDQAEATAEPLAKQATSDVQKTSSAEEPRPAVSPRNEVTSKPRVPPAPSSGRRVHPAARLAAGAALGYLPDTSVGVELGGGLEVGSERVFVELERWGGMHPEVTRSGVPIVASRVGLGPTACVGTRTRMSVDACAGLRAVLIDASGDDMAEPRTDQGWFPSALARFGVAWRGSKSIGLGADLQIQAPLRRVEFRLDSGRSVAALPPLGAAATVALTWDK